ncbi:dTDP-glucose 4,6-dehydratase [Paenibacillus barcinonensis]|uniref:dTDP-glucose 4,6-dehydratase n=1 Tax=Paenibacillus barcinonensis TaxID=198119 RepID=A0A2V4VUA2_PAEBA|nr:dTDP-glucose 4,6-dehydratase [Paenibacillus barcinonensis]PYE50591.1 dTDP-glucose 4,6-dehydratase [Paenibacillus barcinonensis]QKS57290.1 dTDP-glucose 4,6-dehydratase [Paenibacillus barcinonensis]
MKILVTGGAGFIGSNFVLYMLQEHPTYDIINVDALTYAGNLENLKSIESNIRHTFIQADIADVQQMENIFAQGIDVVVNFAAESHVDRSILSPDVFVRTNVMGTQVLLDAAKKYQITKFLQVSTDEVYGSLGPTGLFTEETPLMPNSPYSASKAGGDLLVRAYHETFGLPVNITRCSNNYGPFQFPEKLIPLIIARALNNEAIPVYGDGLNIRDWLYVEDHCRAIDLVMHQGRSGEVYNIGGNNERTNIHIVETVLEQLGKPASLIQYVQDRLGHDRRYGIDPTKLQTELGWKPVHHFETGIKETINWYLNHQDWMARVQSGAYQDDVKLQYGKQVGDSDV